MLWVRTPPESFVFRFQSEIRQRRWSQLYISRLSSLPRPLHLHLQISLRRIRHIQGDVSVESREVKRNDLSRCWSGCTSSTMATIWQTQLSPILTVRRDQFVRYGGEAGERLQEVHNYYCRKENGFKSLQVFDVFLHEMVVSYYINTTKHCE